MSSGYLTHWEVSIEGGYSGKWVDTESETITINLITPPLSKMRFLYTFFQGKVDQCPFVATMKYYLLGGGIWDCEIRGFYDGVETTRVVGTCSLIARWDEKLGKWIDVDRPVITSLKRDRDFMSVCAKQSYRGIDLPATYAD